MSHSARYLSEVAAIAQKLAPEKIEVLCDELVQLRNRGGRLFMIGVGGSAANCSHDFSIREGAIGREKQGWDGIIKPGIDVAMSTISSFGGPIGLGIGMVYFVFDAFGVFDKPIVRV